MSNLLQTVIPAAVTFLVGYQGAYPHQPAPQEHPGGHGYARALPEGHPSRATLTTPVTSAAVQPLSLRPASSWRSCSPAVVTATPPSRTPGPQPPLASPSQRDVRPAGASRGHGTHRRTPWRRGSCARPSNRPDAATDSVTARGPLPAANRAQRRVGTYLGHGPPDNGGHERIAAATSTLGLTSANAQ